MLDAFIDLMDGIFWEGYTQQLAKDNPALFNYEYQEFLNAH